MATKRDLSLDLEGALAGIAPPSISDSLAGAVEAGFFHRTLARWLGLPEGKQPARKKDAAPLWDYDFWKAELVDDGFVDERHVYTARVFRAAHAAGASEEYRYWVRVDGGGRIRASGWLTAPPDLLTDGAGFQPHAPSSHAAAADVARVFDDE